MITVLNEPGLMKMHINNTPNKSIYYSFHSVKSEYVNMFKVRTGVIIKIFKNFKADAFIQYNCLFI